MSVRLFIGNLPYAANEAELREHLSSVGAPTQVVLPVDRETGRPRGFAFVDYRTATSPKKPFDDSTSSPSKAGRSRSARRVPARSADRADSAARDQAGSAAHGRAVPRPARRTAAWRLQRSTSSGRIQAAARHRAAAPGPGPAARTSGPTPPPRTSANRRAKTATADRRVRSRSGRSAGSMTRMTTGAKRTRRSTPTTSPPPPRKTTTSPRARKGDELERRSGVKGPPTCC